ncbi:GTPase IMAP family member 9 [Aplochiton taeniatus]
MDRRHAPDPELRIVVLGGIGPSQFQLTNALLGREEFATDVCSILASKKSLGELAGRRVAVINGPNIYEDLSKAKKKTEVKRSKCLSCPGPHALLIVFDLERISPNDIKVPSLVMKSFGDDCLNYCMVLLAYDGDLDGTALDDRMLRMDWHLRELVEQCGGRYHVFNKNWRDRSKGRELLQKMERMLSSVGGHFYSNRSYQTAEESVRREQGKLQKKKKAEMERARKELENQYSGEELRWQMNAYNTSMETELRAKAEKDNGWLRTSRAVGTGLGFAMGAVMGMLVGAIEGPGGVVVGGVVAGTVGGAAGGAAQIALEHLEDRMVPQAMMFNFNSVFINRFYMDPPQ